MREESRQPTRRDFLRASAGCAAHLAMLAAASPLRAQALFASPRRQLAAQEPWGRLERVADGIWALISTPLQDRTTLCNGGIVRGSAGVVVIESFAQPQGASWLAQKARELTGRWPDDVVLTHYHGDHSGGIAGFVRDDGAPRLRSTNVTRELVRQQDSRRNEDPGSPRAKALTEALIIDAAAESAIDLGDRRLRIIPRDGHTRSDITIEIDDPAVVFCGDLVWNGMFPNYVDAIPSRLSRAVRALVRPTRTVYVPGHGPLGELAELQTYVRLLDSVEQAARNAKTAGRTAAEAAAEFRLATEVAQWTLFSPRYFETAIGAWLRELG
jgi:glyoxylase-like metal-dependent hydrolase (beta-lactamase superfamily II)